MVGTSRTAARITQLAARETPLTVATLTAEASFDLPIY